MEEIAQENETKYEIKVAPEDMGKVIGKQGRIARAIRTIVKTRAAQGQKKVFVDIVEG